MGDFTIEIDQAVNLPQTVLVQVYPPAELSTYELKYHLLENVGIFFTAIRIITRWHGKGLK